MISVPEAISGYIYNFGAGAIYTWYVDQAQVCYNFRHLFGVGWGVTAFQLEWRWCIKLFVSIGVVWVGRYTPGLIANIIPLFSCLSRVRRYRLGCASHITGCSSSWTVRGAHTKHVTAWRVKQEMLRFTRCDCWSSCELTELKSYVVYRQTC